MYPDLICIEGNIGVGKTTLVKKLAAYYQAEEVFEAFEENPWLPLFYANPGDFAFALELSFLTERCKQLIALNEQNKKKQISDYALDKCLLFAKANLSEVDFQAYEKLFSRISIGIGKPQLVIVLHATTSALQKNIYKRNRSYEQSIDVNYLEKMNQLYASFFQKEQDYPVLNIYLDDINEIKYEKVFMEIVSFLHQKTFLKVNSIYL